MAKRGKSSKALKDWQKLAEAELRGKPVASLRWETPEGITVKPSYTEADLTEVAGRGAALSPPANRALHTLLAVALLQLCLGISTLVLVVPIALPAAHQAGAVTLLTAAIVLRHTLRAAAPRRDPLHSPAGAAD